VQQPLPNNQDIQQSLEFMCTLHHVHHLLGQVIAPNTSSNNLPLIYAATREAFYTHGKHVSISHI